MHVTRRRPVVPRHTQRLCLRLPPDLAERLDRAADTHSLRLAEIVREALTRYLARLERAGVRCPEQGGVG